MSPFAKDQTIIWDGAGYKVIRAIDIETVQLERQSDGLLSVHKLSDLLGEYVRGDLLSGNDSKPILRDAPVRKPARMDKLGTVAKQETKRRIDYLVSLNKIGAFEMPRKLFLNAIADIARKWNEITPPHFTTILRWKSKYQKSANDIRAVFSAIDARGGEGVSRLGSEVDAIIDETIESTLDAQRCWSAEEIHTTVYSKIQKLNTMRIEREWIKIPSLRTIQRRLANNYAYDVCVAKYGSKEAERRFANMGRARRVNHILEIVEIDHTPLDILVTNADGVVLGRPYATVIIDRFSRCVLGLHISLAGHGTEAVFSALRHALLPKSYLGSRFADLNLEWNCYGWPSTLLMDNGAEFHAESVVDALLQLGIIGEYAKSKTPNDKPFVERFIKTLNYSFIHKLPGTTFAKVGKRIGFKSEDEACLTLEELDKKIHLWICNQYHLRPHRGLGKRAPLTVWNEGACAFPPQLKMNAETIDIEFSRLATSAIQHYGIDLNTHQYANSRLLTMRRSLPERTKVTVKWSAHDIGHIWVWDPQEEEFFKVLNKDEEYAGITLDQSKAVKKERAYGDPDYRMTRATAQAINDDITQTSLKGKKLKDRRLGTKHSNMTSNDHRQEHVASTKAKKVAGPVCGKPDHGSVVHSVEVEYEEGE